MDQTTNNFSTTTLTGQQTNQASLDTVPRAQDDALTGATDTTQLATGNIVTVVPAPIVGAPPRPVLAPRSDVSLDSFFARPRPLYNYSWTSASGVVVYEPWYDFINNSFVKNKMSMFMNFRATLCMQLVLAPQPMYAGLLMACYQPYLGGQPTRLTNAVSMSNLPHLIINASNGAGGVIKRPFKWTNNFVEPYWNTLTNTALRDIGRLGIVPLAQLGRADGGTVGTIDVQVFVWLEDVQLDTPSYVSVNERLPRELKPNGPVSGPARMIASAAGALKGVPYLTGLASAVELGSNVVGKIATMLGYSKPSNVDDYALVVPRTWGRSAATEGRDPSEKIAMTLTQSVALGAVSGTAVGDQLSFTSLFDHYSYTGYSLLWDTSQAHETYLGKIPICPTITNGGAPHTLGFVSSFFQYWTGSIKIRLQAGASAFHRGRLYIIYDPTNHSDLSAVSPAAMVGVNHMCVLDLSKGTDIEFQVNWCQPGDVARLSADPTTDSSGTTSQNGVPVHNGCLYFFVDAALTSPGTSTIGVPIFIKAGVDFKLYNPAPIMMSGWTSTAEGLAGGTDSSGLDPNVADETCSINPRSDTSAFTGVHFGEAAASLRELSKRWNPWALVYPYGAASPAGNAFALRLRIPQYPMQPGSTVSHHVSLDESVKWGWQNMILCMFGLVRGGMRWRFSNQFGSGSSPDQAVEANISKCITNGGFPQFYYATGTFGQHSAGVQVSAAGGCVVDPIGHNSIEAEVPYNLPTIFAPTAQFAWLGNADPSVGGLGVPGVELVLRTAASGNLVTAMAIDCWCAAADDFDVDAFIGPSPTITARDLGLTWTTLLA